MGDYDFYLCSSYLTSFISSISNFIELLNDNIDSIYYGIDGMEVGWSGESYESFKKDVEGFRDPLTELCIFMVAFKNILSNQGPRVTNCIEKINSELERLELE